MVSSVNVVVSYLTVKIVLPVVFYYVFFFVWILQISQRVCHHLSFIRKFSVVLILVSTVGPFPDNVVDVVCRLQKFG